MPLSFAGQVKFKRTSNKNFPHLLLMLNDRPAKPAFQSTKRAIITIVQASKQVITCHCLQFYHSTHLSLFFALTHSRSQRQSSRHGPERAVALTIGPVFRLPSSIEHGAQPVKIVEVSMKVSFWRSLSSVIVGYEARSRIGYLEGMREFARC